MGTSTQVAVLGAVPVELEADHVAFSSDMNQQAGVRRGGSRRGLEVFGHTSIQRVANRFEGLDRAGEVDGTALAARSGPEANRPNRLQVDGHLLWAVGGEVQLLDDLLEAIEGDDQLDAAHWRWTRIVRPEPIGSPASWTESAPGSTCTIKPGVLPRASLAKKPQAPTTPTMPKTRSRLAATEAWIHFLLG